MYHPYLTEGFQTENKKAMEYICAEFKRESDATHLKSIFDLFMLFKSESHADSYLVSSIVSLLIVGPKNHSLPTLTKFVPLSQGWQHVSFNTKLHFTHYIGIKDANKLNFTKQSNKNQCSPIKHLCLRHRYIGISALNVKIACLSCLSCPLFILCLRFLLLYFRFWSVWVV